MKKLILLTVLFMVMGQLECTRQTVCPGEYIRDRTLIDRGDGFEICDDCTNTVTIMDDLSAATVTEDAEMEYLGGGYYGYKIQSPPYYSGRAYTAYVTSTSPMLSGEGGACITFTVKDCTTLNSGQNTATTTAGETPTPATASPAASGVVGSVTDALDFIKALVGFAANPQSYITAWLHEELGKDRSLLDIASDMLDFVVDMGGFIVYVDSFLRWLITQLVLFTNNPVKYLLVNFWGTIMSFVWTLIKATLMVVLFVEAFFAVFALFEGGSDVFKIISREAHYHAQVLRFMGQGFMGFVSLMSQTAQAGIQLVAAIGNWIPFT